MKLITDALEHRSIVWLRGVRRAGKTFLCKSFKDIVYYDCEMPDVRRKISEESFLSDNNGKFLALDEIHRLDNPAQLLKLAADHFPETKIIATGSSLLETIKKFSDTLTGRKTTVFLTPATALDAVEFGVKSIEDRMLKGGLPPFMLSDKRNNSDYDEWIESFWAQNITGLFKLEKRDSFLKLVELVMNESSGLFDARRYAGLCEVSRPTIKNYVSVLESTALAYVLRPYSGKSKKEIVSMPKIYGFDTGFMAFVKGWNELRTEDYGIMWEHLVLNEMMAVIQNEKLYYWRDKQKHEIDFILKGSRKEVHAIECKWQSKQFDHKNLQIFRRRHPQGKNYVISHDIKKTEKRKKQDLEIIYLNIPEIKEIFSA